jgi:hypothetical protein
LNVAEGETMSKSVKEKLLAAGIDLVKNKDEIESLLQEERDRKITKDDLIEELYDKYYKEMCPIIIDVDVNMHNVMIRLGCVWNRLNTGIITAKCGDRNDIEKAIQNNKKVKKWYARTQEIIKEIKANKQLSKQQKFNLINDLLDQDPR